MNFCTSTLRMYYVINALLSVRRLDLARLDRRCLKSFIYPSQLFVFIGKLIHNRTQPSVDLSVHYYVCSLTSVQFPLFFFFPSTLSISPRPSHYCVYLHSYYLWYLPCTALLLVLLALVLTLSLTAIDERISLYPILPTLWYVDHHSCSYIQCVCIVSLHNLFPSLIYIEHTLYM